MTLRTFVAATLEAIHCRGLSGEYGLPQHLPGDELLTTLAQRLPALIDGL